MLARHRVHDGEADLVGAGEGDHRQALVLYEGGHPVVGDGQHRPGADGQLGLGEQFTDEQAGERRRRGGLENDRGADGDGRGDLVRAEIQREVERRDAENDATREATGQREATGAACVGVESLGLAAVEPTGLLGREPEDGDGAAHLAPCPLHGLAVLRGDQTGDLLGALDETPRHMVKRRGPDMRGRRGELVAHGVRGGHGLLDLFLCRDGDLADNAAVPRGGDVEGLLPGGLASGEPEGMGGCHSFVRHLRVPALPKWWRCHLHRRGPGRARDLSGMEWWQVRAATLWHRGSSLRCGSWADVDHPGTGPSGARAANPEHVARVEADSAVGAGVGQGPGGVAEVVFRASQSSIRTSGSSSVRPRISSTRRMR